MSKKFDQIFDEWLLSPKQIRDTYNPFLKAIAELDTPLKVPYPIDFIEKCVGNELTKN